MLFIYKLRKMPFLNIYLCVAANFIAQLHSSFGIHTSDIDLIITAHNDFRRRFANGRYSTFVGDMPKLEWSYILQLQAEREIGCNLISSLNNIDPYDVRMNFGISRLGNLSQIISTWTQEVQHYLPAFKTCIYLRNCKHFLTIVTSKHKRMGCATADSCEIQNTRVTSLLCLYEGGTAMDIPPFKVGQPCTKCNGPTSFCDYGLCVSCDPSLATTCDCRKTCNKRNVGVGNLDNSTCTCTCLYGMGPNCDEECANPDMYVDWNPCESITQQDCINDGEILQEFCPENCVCNKYPAARILADVVRGAALRNPSTEN